MSQMTPVQALQILVTLMNRLSLSPVEMAGAQVAVDVLKGVVEPKDPPKQPESEPSVTEAVCADHP